MNQYRIVDNCKHMYYHLELEYLHFDMGLRNMGYKSDNWILSNPLDMCMYMKDLILSM